MATHTVGHVCPAFQKHAAAPILLQSRAPLHLFRRCSFQQNIQSTLQADEVPPTGAIHTRQLHQSLGALAGAAHQLLAGSRRRTDAALDLYPDNFELRMGSEDIRKCLKGFGDGAKLGASFASDSESEFIHLSTKHSADSNGS